MQDDGRAFLIADGEQYNFRAVDCATKLYFSTHAFLLSEHLDGSHNRLPGFYPINLTLYLLICAEAPQLLILRNWLIFRKGKLKRSHVRYNTIPRFE